jgi:hypothetical protein
MKDHPTTHPTMHPTRDILLAYLEDAEQAQFADVRLHIATCSDCRGTLQQLNNLQHTLKTTGPYQNRLETISPQLASALQRQTIERYVDGDLSPPENAAAKQLLQDEPAALKAALHYASHSAANSHLSTAHLTNTNSTVTEPATTRTRSGISLLEQLKKLLEFKPPVWISVPATAAAVFAITLAVMPQWTDSTSAQFTVAAYQDKPVIHFQAADQLPGIGFFNKARRSTENFGPMEIQYNDHQELALHWPAVPNATSYHLALYLIGEGQKITVQEMDITTNQATITAFKAQSGKRYEWTLNGETGDARSFYTSGGFVINKTDNRDQ